MLKRINYYQINTIKLLSPKLKAYAIWGGLNFGLFVLLYPLLNEFAIQSSLRTLTYQWELEIPFYSWAIIPYLSINLLFLVQWYVIPKQDIKQVGVLFLCATIISSICFYLFPVQNSYERVIPSGLFQGLYQTLYWFDKPGNMIPSLHVVYTTLFAATTLPYIQSAFARAIYILWILLILASVFLTHQHHVLDVVVGFGLAVSLLWLVRMLSR